jgi:hypothetical protein
MPNNNSNNFDALASQGPSKALRNLSDELGACASPISNYFDAALASQGPSKALTPSVSESPTVPIFPFVSVSYKVAKIGQPFNFDDLVEEEEEEEEENKEDEVILPNYHLPIYLQYSNYFCNKLCSIFWK